MTPKEGPWKSYRQHFTLTGGAPKVETAKASVGGDTRAVDVVRSSRPSIRFPAETAR